MRFQRCLPLIGLAAMASATLYTAPKTLVAMVESDDCDNSDLPDDFDIKYFVGQSADEGKTLESFDFTFVDDSNSIQTRCHFNSTSKNLSDEGRAPKFSCENNRIKFIYEDAILSVIEGICPKADGSAPYEASGAAQIFLDCEEASSCSGGGQLCSANVTDITGQFFSLKPTNAGSGLGGPPVGGARLF